MEKMSFTPCLNENCRRTAFIIFSRVSDGNFCSQECLNAWTAKRYAEWKSRQTNTLVSRDTLFDSWLRDDEEVENEPS